MTTRGRLAMLAAVLCLAGCASAGPPKGVSGPVQWEVVDLTRETTPDGGKVTWRYTVVLRELHGRAITFDRQEWTHLIDAQVIRPNEEPFARRLEAGAELRLPSTSSVFWNPGAKRMQGASGSSAIPAHRVEIWRRFFGTDDAGRPVTVNVRFYPEAAF